MAVQKQKRRLYVDVVERFKTAADEIANLNAFWLLDLIAARH